MTTKPTKYKKSYAKKKLAEYLDSCQDNDYEFHKTRGDKSDSYEEKTTVKLPSKEGFADFLGVSRKSLYNWEKEHPEFAAALEKIHNEQLTRLVNRGLEGTYNPTIVKLLLSHNHQMKERSDITSDDEPINPYTDDQINRIAERVAARRRSDGSLSSSE